MERQKLPGKSGNWRRFCNIGISGFVARNSDVIPEPDVDIAIRAESQRQQPSLDCVVIAWHL